MKTYQINEDGVRIATYTSENIEEANEFLQKLMKESEEVGFAEMNDPEGCPVVCHCEEHFTIRFIPMGGEILSLEIDGKSYGTFECTEEDYNDFDCEDLLEHAKKQINLDFLKGATIDMMMPY